MVDNNESFARLLEANKRARTAEAEAAKLRARLAELQKENDRPSDAPAVPDSSEDDEASGAWEIGEDGKLRKRKVKADDKPADEQGCDKPKTEEQQEEAATKARALLVVNAWRRSIGLPLVSRLIQDESIVPAGLVIDPRDSETLARAVVGAFRKAKGLPQLARGEWISVTNLRGER